MKTTHDNIDEQLRCDVCGKFVSPCGNDGAVRYLITPDAEGCSEEWETLCKEHANFDAIDNRRHV